MGIFKKEGMPRTVWWTPAKTGNFTYEIKKRIEPALAGATRPRVQFKSPRPVNGNNRLPDVQAVDFWSFETSTLALFF